jgi:hypothetical protein
MPHNLESPNTILERIDASSMGTGSIPGLKTIRLQDGTPLNYVDDNTFKNAATGDYSLARHPH